MPRNPLSEIHSLLSGGSAQRLGRVVEISGTRALVIVDGRAIWMISDRSLTVGQSVIVSGTSIVAGASASGATLEL